ncbi:hypothetical protein EMIHUDRAFT_106991 [Emiliania huxleyi CCMP1516]|uniref:Inward rectifier potassium channel C-terminal domain-containing protein n=2 Tax=Emiliania huxleyi TaxID=2903 RepID=A0A0D3I4G4_EMIH1|nr:hypothetical protein EMIHUDRAFT_106991 [Emiliania huxleyi CCMP1516]EOD06149.1 hypothetical protein EMIHUDRAFT_106991 [Emiliania huxleyi CCMP1516]|eukprot:XP_005758578.1 hypothetical protein EMIHUDRAFT_106991 [Emiliania huxleyi CCMP1516]
MSSADPLQSFDRLLDRDGTFRQSRGRFNIVRRLPRRISCSFYLEDWFHSLVNTRIHRIFLVLVLFYLTAYFGFAFAFSLVDDVCLPDYYSDHPGDGVKRFVRSLYFSLETMMAIGHRASCRRSAMYGSKDPAAGGCILMWALVTAASLCGVFAQSFLFGIVFVRLSRADARASTVAFSSCAIVRAAHGALFLAFRVAEMRKRHHLLGVRARAYAFVDIGDGTECFPLPLEAPAPSGDLLLATPALIVHRLDDLSPLVPPHPSAKPAARAVAPPPPPPPRLHPVRLVCGLMSVAGSVAGEEEGRTAHLRSRMEQIREHMRAQSVEARHSYTAHDIAWDSTFAPCTRRVGASSDGGPGLSVDFLALHATLPLVPGLELPPDAELFRLAQPGERASPIGAPPPLPARTAAETRRPTALA